MAALATSPEIGILEEEDTLSYPQQALTNTHGTVNLGPCIQYEDTDDVENGSHNMIVVVNADALQIESSLNNELELQQGHSELSTQMVCEDETKVLEWFRSTFSQAEKNGIITRKDFEHTARHSAVSYSRSNTITC